jgi:hypothetical protein
MYAGYEDGVGLRPSGNGGTDFACRWLADETKLARVTGERSLETRDVPVIDCRSPYIYRDREPKTAQVFIR